VTKGGDLILRFTSGGEADELAEAAAHAVFRELAAQGLGPAPVPAEAPRGAKAAEAVTAASILINLLPGALEGLLGIVSGVLSRPGAPQVEITIEDKGRKVAVKFDPRRISGADTVKLAAELRSQVFGERPRPG